MAGADDPFAFPSLDPSAPLSLGGVFRGVIRKMLEDVDDCLPCSVVATDGRKWATVKPLVRIGTTDGQAVSRAQIARVPVLVLGAGGGLLSFPIKAGDLGWLKASDRDISLFLQGLAENLPNTRRLHSFEDGVFIPHSMRDWVLNAEDADRIVLQTVDGLARIAVGGGIVKLTAPTVEVEGNLSVSTGATASVPTGTGGVLTIEAGIVTDYTPP